MTLIKKPLNYLNNKDILKEIHLSKNTYCSFVEPLDHQYDYIIDYEDGVSLENSLHHALKPEILQKAKENRAYRLGIESGTKIDPTTIDNGDLVFRVMTWDHVPLAPKAPKKIDKKKSAKELFEFELDEETMYEDLDDPKLNKEMGMNDMIHVRVNFPPFQHFKYAEASNQMYCVGKSHWRGDIYTGHFDKDKGQITNKLAKMYLMLCEKYAMRFNWRGYCVDNQTEALTQRGWLSYEHINEDDKILSYHDKKLTWSSIKSIYRGQYNGIMHYMSATGLDSLVTPEHKLVTENGLKKIEYVLEHDKLVLMGEALQDTDSDYSDDFVELIGWILTEGSYDYYENNKIKHIRIYQNTGHKADRIRKSLTSLNIEYHEGIRKNNICFRLNSASSKEIFQVIPNKNLTMSFMLSINYSQRVKLLETMIDGDGWRTGYKKQQLHYVQKDKTHIDMFQALCTMVGLRSNYHLRHHVSYGKPTSSYTVNIFSKRKNSTRFENVNLHGGKQNGRAFVGKGKESHPNLPTVPYNGTVWCPETEYGCFVARRNGTIFLTGNTYNDEMRGAAILQLTYVGLRFNEAKSSNPFAYYTAAITNSFCRVLNTEKKNQGIRDDILEANGLNPSWSRQFAEES